MTVKRCSVLLKGLELRRPAASGAADPRSVARATTNSVARPSPTATRTAAAVPAGNGATAQCNDGTHSYAAHHQGACSRHGGVRQFDR